MTARSVTELNHNLLLAQWLAIKMGKTSVEKKLTAASVFQDGRIVLTIKLMHMGLFICSLKKKARRLAPLNGTFLAKANGTTFYILSVAPVLLGTRSRRKKDGATITPLTHLVSALSPRMAMRQGS